MALVAIFVFTSIVKASLVDPQQAIQVAQQFVPKSTTSQRASMRGSQSEPSSSIVYTHMMPSCNRPAFYIVNVDDRAFVLVSADDIAHQVLGYSISSTWPVAKDGSVELPEQIKGFFDDLAAQIEAAIEAETTQAVGSYKASPRSAAPNRSPSRPDSVGPLLTTTWNQGKYYNALCPEDADGPDGHAQTGCVATAMAQIVKYWSDSTPGRGTHSYSTNYGTLSVNFAEASYDFASMPNVLDENSTQEQINAVAQLMYHCGVATNMAYGPSESSAMVQDARAGLINFYHLSPNLSFAEKAFFSDADWNDLLHQEIAANRPILYSGYGDSGGHTFICDGYKADNYYHFNFGWGGFCDGWYLTSAINPNDLNYNSNQTALLGIVPDASGNVILGQTTGNSTFTVDEPLEFYNLMGHNSYEGSNYNNPCDNTITFIPVDNSKQIVADIMVFEDQRVRIYNGNNTSNLLIDLNGGYENDLSPAVSTENAIMIKYSGNMYYAGFKLNISQDNGLRMVSNIVSSIEATTVHLMWSENGTASQWQIEYGVKGFELGKGVLYNSTTNTATFDNLEKFTEYDFYIRSNYENDQHGLWNKITLMIEAPYWQDIVTSQPKGYYLNGLNNTVRISTAEGFAWWARNGCEYDAYLTADIDLSGFKWRPTSASSHLFGQGHLITHAYINERTNDVGLFSDYGSGTSTIADVGLEYFNVIGRGNRTGGLCGTLRGIIRNCYIKNSVIDGGDFTGGLIGESMFNGTVLNCYVNVHTIGARWAGLMIGDSYGVVKNCYASGSFRQRAYCYNGGIVAYSHSGQISNCYSIEMPMGVVGYVGNTTITDTASFDRNGISFTLRSPVLFDDIHVSDLISALNLFVEQVNDKEYCVWKPDEKNTNDGYPIFGDKHVVKYPNVSDVIIQNVKNGNKNSVSLTWKENGEATQWKIRYRRHEIPNAPYTYVTTTDNPTTIQGIPLGYVYDFNVRAIGEGEAMSGWSDTKEHTVDLLYWTDIVTSQPEGYLVDDNGNVEISSAEGLAWFAAKVNGFHKQKPDIYEGKTIVLTADIDLEGYRWCPIGCFEGDLLTCFSGLFDGQNHTISNIYINDTFNALGLFGHINKGGVRNVIMDGGSVAGIIPTSCDIGGLIGYGQELKEISNCHSSVNVYGNEDVGSLCGYVRSDDVTTVVSNCSAKGLVSGRSGCGGLIGTVYGNIIIENSYATGNVNISSGASKAWYRGGLIGYFVFARAYNCYSIGVVTNDPNSGYYGKVIGCPYRNTHIHNIYGLGNVNEGWELVGNDCEDIADTAQFHHEETLNTLIKSITVGDEDYSELLGVLNAWVRLQNDHNLKMWVLDNNTGYPVFGDNYKPSCYNPTDLAVSQATIVGDSTIRTKIAWDQIGEPDYWEVLYVAAEHNIEDGVIVTVDSNPCVLTDIPIGHPLDFYVRAINNDDEKSNWSALVTYIPDKLRWTEVVTSQPEGYTEDAEGNVYISSAEGLAWLSSVVNGLNGMEYDGNRFWNKHIELVSDINMSEYRWTALGKNWEYSLDFAAFNGNNHSINGLYSNELEDYQGLFGCLRSGNISNVILSNCNVLGENYSGSIAGYALAVSLTNCAVVGNVYGIDEVGGLVGRHASGDINQINNCYFRGIVSARRDITKANTNVGYVGGIIGSSHLSSINNCYVVSEITDDGVWSGIITSSGLSPSQVSNCYYKAYETTLPITNINCNTSNNSSFFGNSTTWTLNTPPYIGDSFYTNLVDALNAWVDANNLNGKYRHWESDTANANGGYPIFAPLPNCLVTFKNANGDTLQIDTLEYGSLPVYRGTTPTLESTEQYSYLFLNWSPEIVAVTNDTTYTAVFDSIVNKYILTYKVDGADYKKDTLAYNASITPLPALTKEGYTFSGWSDIPAVMPANDVEVIGSFTLNKYLLSVLIDGVVEYSDSIEYGTRLAEYADLIKEKGIDISQWEWYDQIETITMPAHDITINAVRDGILPITINEDESAIFDLTGKKIDIDDISTLPAGIYIRNESKFIIK